MWSDVRNVDWGGQYRNTVDIIFGGFPCQDLSVAGKQAGLEGARSGLWFEMLGAIEAIRPRFVVAENVRGAINLALDTVQAGLEAANYEVWPFLLPAAAVGAPHKRERMFVIGIRNDVADTYRKRVEGRGKRGKICGMRAQPSDGAAGCSSSVLADAGSVLLPWRFERRDIQAPRETGFASDAEFSSGALWPTPRAAKVNGENLETWKRRKEKGDVATPPLGLAVKMWPTPTVSDTFTDKLNSSQHKEDSMHSVTLAQASHHENQSGGQLNPDWVEQLMNFPEGWTDPECKEPQPWQGWPAPLGADQCPYEFSRTTKIGKNRASRLRALGNAVVPAQAYPLFKAIAEIERMVTD